MRSTANPPLALDANILRVLGEKQKLMTFFTSKQPDTHSLHHAAVDLHRCRVHVRSQQSASTFPQTLLSLSEQPPVLFQVGLPDRAKETSNRACEKSPKDEVQQK